MLMMDYCTGTTLEEYIKSKQKIPLSATKTIMFQLLYILNQLHKQGIVHRDVKPSNILIDDTLRVYLVDFNLAKSVSLDESTKTHSKFKIKFTSPKCSYMYMPPEMNMTGVEFNESVDIFSVGLILYILVFGFKNYLAISKNKSSSASKNHGQLM